MNNYDATIARAREYRDRIAAKVAEIDAGHLQLLEVKGRNQPDVTAEYRAGLASSVEQADRLIRFLQRSSRVGGAHLDGPAA